MFITKWDNQLQIGIPKYIWTVQFNRTLLRTKWDLITNNVSDSVMHDQITTPVRLRVKATVLASWMNPHIHRYVSHNDVEIKITRFPWGCQVCTTHTHAHTHMHTRAPRRRDFSQVSEAIWQIKPSLNELEETWNRCHSRYCGDSWNELWTSKTACKKRCH